MEKKIALTGIRLTEDVKDRIRVAAQKKELSLSQWIRKAIMEKLAQVEAR